MTTDGLRAAIYLRVSRDDQTTENQRRVLARVAEHRDCTIVQTYEDQGIRGAKGRDRRPVFDQMLNSLPGSRNVVVAFTHGAVIGTLGGLKDNMTRTREHVMMGEPTTFVLGADDGEHLLNASGEVVIKIDPRRGSAHLSLGTQHVPSGAGIPRHRHAYWDEFIYVLDGSGTVILNDERAPIQKGV